MMSSAHIHEAIEVFQCNKRGRGVRVPPVSPHGIRPGTCLVREEPAACVLFSQEFTRRCENCLQKRDKLRTCSGCNELRYCSRQCQSEGWIHHQYECRYKKKNKHSKLPSWSSARVMIRIIHQHNKHQKKHKNKTVETPRDFPTTVEQLCDGELTSNQEMLSYYTQTAASLFEFVNEDTIQGWDTEQVTSLYSKLQVNGFCLLDAETRKPIGEVIYTRSAVFNHSCDPNCCFVFNGTTIEIRSIRDILPGEECLINYVNLLKPTSQRKQDLFDVYGFWCDCMRCKESIEETEDEEDSDCSTSSSSEAEQLGDKLYRQIEDMEIAENHYQVLELSQDALLQLEPLLDSTHHIMASIYICAVEACIALEEWDEAVVYGQHVITACSTHLSASNPLIGFYKWRVAQIQAGELKQLVAARAKLHKAIDILSVGYGSSHPITVAAKELLGTITDHPDAVA